MAGPHLILSTTGHATNIGDYGHTASALQVLRTAAPDGGVVTVWPKRRFTDREEAFLREAFDDLRIVNGEMGVDGVPSTVELAEAIESADLLVHGSGPSLLRAEEVAGWATATGRPYGFFGVTSDPLLPSGTSRLVDGTPYPSGGSLTELAQEVARFAGVEHLGGVRRQVADGAAFLHCRDSLSQSYLSGQGITVAEFGPDAFFHFGWTDEAYAECLWSEHGLDGEQVVAVVPRVRHAPYHRGRPGGATDEDLRRSAENEQFERADSLPVNELITELVRGRGVRVLLCPEMGNEIETAQRLVLPELPDDVVGSVDVVTDVWMPHQAAAVYARCAAVVSMHCHSPILAAVHQVPLVYHRLPTETLKGQMWHDIGLGDRVVEGNAPDAAARLQQVVAEVLDAPAAEQDRLAAAVDAVRGRLAGMAAQVWQLAEAVRR